MTYGFTKFPNTWRISLAKVRANGTLRPETVDWVDFPHLLPPSCLQHKPRANAEPIAQKVEDTPEQKGPGNSSV